MVCTLRLNDCLTRLAWKATYSRRVDAGRQCKQDGTDAAVQGGPEWLWLRSENIGKGCKVFRKPIISVAKGFNCLLTKTPIAYQVPIYALNLSAIKQRTHFTKIEPQLKTRKNQSQRHTSILKGTLRKTQKIVLHNDANLWITSKPY